MDWITAVRKLVPNQYGVTSTVIRKRLTGSKNLQSRYQTNSYLMPTPETKLQKTDRKVEKNQRKHSTAIKKEETLIHSLTIDLRPPLRLLQIILPLLAHVTKDLIRLIHLSHTLVSLLLLCLRHAVGMVLERQLLVSLLDLRRRRLGRHT